MTDWCGYQMTQWGGYRLKSYVNLFKSQTPKLFQSIFYCIWFWKLNYIESIQIKYSESNKASFKKIE